MNNLRVGDRVIHVKHHPVFRDVIPGLSVKVIETVEPYDDVVVRHLTNWLTPGYGCGTNELELVSRKAQSRQDLFLWLRNAIHLDDK